MYNKKMSNAHQSKTLFAFKKENEKAVLSKVHVSSTYEHENIVYATLSGSKYLADLSSVKHLLVGTVAGV